MPNHGRNTLAALSKLTLLLLMFILPPDVRSGNGEDDIVDKYISPGVQFGYGFGKGWFIGSQMTFGLNYDESAIAVGTTLGTRRYFDAQKTSMRYWDIQRVEDLGLGVGVGIAATKLKDSETWEYGPRIKLWVGALLLPTYDYTYTMDQEKSNIHNFGGMGVLPLGGWMNR